MGRSIRVAPEHIERVQLALRQSSYPSQSALAIDVGLTRPTVNSFFNGKPIDYLNFVEISQKLNLDWQAIAAKHIDGTTDLDINTLDIRTIDSNFSPRTTIPDILVVDDRPDNIRLLSSMLSERGYKVRKAVNGMMTLTAVQTSAPDLILLDITMPQMDGYEVCQRLKSSPKTKDIPIIFISALDEVLDKVRAFNLGGVDYITKPFQVEEVIARVENQLTICHLKNQLKQQNHLLEQEVEHRVEVDQVLQEQNILLQKEIQSRLKTEKLLKEQNLILQAEIQTRQNIERHLQEKNIQLQKESGDRLILTNQIKEKEQQLAALIANIPGVVYRAISHQDGRVTMPYLSPRIKQLLGITVQEFTETFEWIFDVVHPEDRMELYRALEESKRQLSNLDYEYRLVQELGAARWVRILAQPHQSINKDIVWDGVIIDISQQKNMEIAYELLLESMEIDYRQSEELLQSIFPQEIAQHLKQTRKPIACAYDAVSVLFADIVGFTQVCSHFSASETVELLNHIFSNFDHLSNDYGLEKIKTIGDQYMVVSGMPNPRPDHAEIIADMALSMLTEITKFKNHLNQPMSLRIGINSGAVVAGVIGSNKFVYDIWGDAVNIASRMESHGEPQRIQVSEATYLQLKDRYTFEKRGEIPIKGKGNMTTYWLISKNT
ncbi:PAS domain S-box [Synechococcus sp. PCC 7502]|uniref:adenylate/guanylate cyclase domain-containing protein n=1 Tax=Synechococcus sp. PCC 7502 TaxID=1173263 RepID=UPI00029FFC34|nr:adenylate/guanylate cyclase domain-containing protein [Synechococcus sp. PCC 7502]AFY72777.1 PAS domain S-box [Synechococcus sp. PCC 7502]